MDAFYPHHTVNKMHVLNNDFYIFKYGFVVFGPRIGGLISLGNT